MFTLILRLQTAEVWVKVLFRLSNSASVYPVVTERHEIRFLYDQDLCKKYAEKTELI